MEGSPREKCGLTEHTHHSMVDKTIISVLYIFTMYDSNSIKPPKHFLLHILCRLTIYAKVINYHLKAVTIFVTSPFLFHKCLLYCLFINTPDSFSTPIGGERVTWGCLNL